MVAPSIRPVRNGLYGRHIGCTRRNSYQLVSRTLVGAPASSGGMRSVARRAHIVELCNWKVANETSFNKDILMDETKCLI